MTAMVVLPFGTMPEASLCMKWLFACMLASSSGSTHAYGAGAFSVKLYSCRNTYGAQFQSRFCVRHEMWCLRCKISLHDHVISAWPVVRHGPCSHLFSVRSDI